MPKELLEQIYPNLDRQEALKELDPRDQGDYLEVACPSCGEREAFIYRNGITITCNRLDKCSYSSSLWDYIQQRDGLDNKGTLETLASYANYNLPELGTGTARKYQSELSKQEITGKALAYMQDLLFKPEGAATLDYLKGRGYSEGEIKAAGFGHYPPIENLKRHLGTDLAPADNKDFSIFKPQRDGVGLGTTHTLVIPYRNEWERVEGFIVRSLLNDEELKPHKIQKYVLNRGLKRGGQLFNFKALGKTRRLIIVEGYIDALIATAKGIDGVVATGGAKIPKEQIDHALKRGISQFMLVLDTDKAGTEGTEAAIKAINERKGKAYVVTLPEGYKDPDELIRLGEEGVKAFMEAVDNAKTAATWAANSLLSKHGLPSKQEIPQPLRDTIIDEALAFAETFQDPIAPADYMGIIAKALRIPAQTLALEQEAYNRRKAEADKKQAYKSLASQLSQLVRDGKEEEIASTVKAELEEIQYRHTSRIIRPYTLEELDQDIRQTQEGLLTGYSMLDNLVTIEPGTITLLAARPSHGKTTLLTNLLLNMVQQYPEDSFYFFSYEETKLALALNVVNILAGKTISKTKNKAAIKEYLRTGLNMDFKKEPLLDEAKETFGEWAKAGRLSIFEEALDVDSLASIIISEKRRNPKLKAVFIDYIQKIRYTGQGANTRQVELQRISGKILEAAKQANIPIILAAQFNREGIGEEPGLHQLREAGDLEQDANIVLSLYNKAVDTAHKEGQEVVVTDKLPIKIKILKNRNGSVGSHVMLDFYPQTLRLQEAPREARL